MSSRPVHDVSLLGVTRLPVTRRLVFAIGLFVLVALSGIVALRASQGISLGDAAYLVIITVFAVGFDEVVELDGQGRAIVSGIIILGVGSFTFLTLSFIEFLVEGHLLDIVGRRRMQRQLDDLEDHMIVCGFGRVGRQVADDLVASSTPMVIVDPDAERLLRAEERGIPYVLGSADDEDALEAAGIQRAAGVAAVTQDDALNVLITLTAKLARPDVAVVVRLKNSHNTTKAFQAGADRVISPTEIGGHRIAALLTKPNVVDFLDVVTHASDVDLVLEEVQLREGGRIVGRSLSTARVRDTYGANVVAIRPAGESRVTTRPDPRTKLVPGDVLVLIGPREDLERLAEENGVSRRRQR